MVFFYLGIFVKVNLPDHVRHPCLDDLKAVFLQISFNIMIRARMEIQKIFSNDQHPRFLPGPVIPDGIHHMHRFPEALGRSADPVLLKAVDHQIHCLFKCLIGASLHGLIGADFPEQFLKHIDHRHRKGNPERRLKIHLITRMQVVAVLIVISQDRHLRKSRIVQCFPKQSAVVGQTAVTYIFSHGDSRVVHIVFSALQCGKRLSDHHLSRETDIVVHILLAEPDGCLPADFQRLCSKPLPLHRSRHNPRKCMGSIWHQYHFFFSVPIRKFHRIRLPELFCLKRFSLLLLKLPLHIQSFHKGTHTDPKRSLHITFIHLQHQRRLPGYFLHDPDDLI